MQAGISRMASVSLAYLRTLVSLARLIPDIPCEMRSSYIDFPSSSGADQISRRYVGATHAAQV
jgi:hypothetical protein